MIILVTLPPLEISVIKLGFHKVRNEPLDRDKLSKYKSGIVKTNLQFKKKILGNISRPGLDLSVVKSNVF